MTTTNPNPFASPASEPAPSVFNQFNASGLNMTPGQVGISQFRARGGIPLGSAQKMASPAMTPPQGGQLGAVTSMPAMGVRTGPVMTPPQGGPVATPATMPSAQPGQMPGRIRPPTAGFLRPRNMPGPNPITSTY